MTWQTYVDSVDQLIDTFARTQGPAVEEAAGLLAASLGRGGVLHVFGSGHSQMAAQEVYLRAGGLAAVNAILDNNLSFYGTVNSDQLERLEGYARILLCDQDLRAGEVLVVVSNSGVNPVPIEVAQIGRDRGCRIVAVTSAANYADTPSRHSSGVRLSDVADVVIDTSAPVGDAIVRIDGMDHKVGAASTVLTAIAMQSVVVEAIARSGTSPDIFRSANVPGGDADNVEIAKRHRDRLPQIRI
jgi:uncharacterized phosphosugar-binding protein